MMSQYMYTLKGGAEGKIWLEPIIKIAHMYEFTSRQQKIIMEIIIVKLLTFKQKWNEHFLL